MRKQTQLSPRAGSVSVYVRLSLFWLQVRVYGSERLPNFCH